MNTSERLTDTELDAMLDALTIMRNEYITGLNIADARIDLAHALAAVRELRARRAAEAPHESAPDCRHEHYMVTCAACGTALSANDEQALCTCGHPRKDHEFHEDHHICWACERDDTREINECGETNAPGYKCVWYRPQVDRATRALVYAGMPAPQDAERLGALVNELAAQCDVTVGKLGSGEYAYFCELYGDGGPIVTGSGVSPCAAVEHAKKLAANKAARND